MNSLQRTCALLAPCVLSVALLSAPALAATQTAPSPAPSASALPEIGNVTTSDRRNEPIANTTHPTFVVDRNTIEAFGSLTIGDALANVPGIDFFSYGPFGAQNNYGIRGTTSAQTLILQDGMPIAAGSSGTVDLGSLSTIGVQRIEVVESGSSTLYGSGATGGVINIITSVEAQPYLRYSDATYGNQDIAAQAGVGGLAVSFERHTATNIFDYPAFNYAGGNATPAGTRVNDAAQQTVARISYLAQLGAGWTAHFAAGDSGINIGVPSGLSFLTPYAQLGTNRTDGLLDLSHTAGPSTIDLTLSSVAQKLQYMDTLADLTGGGPGFGQQNTFDARSQASLRYTISAAKSDLAAGIDLARETALITSPPPTPAVGAAQSQAAAYAQVGYNVGSALRLVFGVRGENDTPAGGVVAPSFGTRLHLGAAQLSANVSESYGVPTLSERYYPGFSNPNLLPERLSNYDTTLSFPHIGGGISFGYFGRDGSNLIVSSSPTYIPFNASRASVNGFQITAATPPFAGLRLSASLTNLYRAIDTSTGMRLPNTPPVIATLGIERPFDAGKLAFGAHLRIVGSSPDVPNFGGGAPFADPYDGYTTADAYLRYRITTSAIISARVMNLTNQRYAPIFGYPAPGRTLQLELATR